MLDITSDRVPEFPNSPSDWFLKRKQILVERWNNFTLKQSVSAIALLSVAVFVVTALIAYPFSVWMSSPSPTVQAAPLALVKSAQAQGNAASTVAATSTSDSLSLIQQDFNILNEAAVQTKQTVDENRAMINVHSVKIRSIEDSLKDNPTVVKSLSDDMQKLKEVMSKPLVPLIPMSVPAANDKTS